MPARVLDWVKSVARAALLATVLTASYLCFSNDFLTFLCALALWAIPLTTKALSSRALLSLPIVCQQFLVVVLCCETITLVAERSQDRTYDGIWLAPLFLLLLLQALEEFLTPTPVLVASPTEKEKLIPKRGAKLPPPLPPSIPTFRFFLPAAVIVLTASILNALASTEVSTLLRLILLLLSTLSTLGIFFYLWRSGTSDIDDTIEVWIVLHVCRLPVMPTEWLFLVRCGMCSLMAVALVLRMSQVEGSLFTWLKTLVSWTKTILFSNAPYELAYFIALSLVAQTLEQVWFRTHFDFPPIVQTPADLGLDILETVVKPFYEFTSEPDFQNTLSIAIPEIGQLRGIIFRTLAVIYRPLTIAANGRSTSYIPFQDSLALAAFGICLVCALCIVLRVFVRDTDAIYLADSPFVWIASTIASVYFLLHTQLTGDSTVAFFHFLFQGGTYVRTYTDEGRAALTAQVFLLITSLALFLVTSHNEVEEETAIEVAKKPIEVPPTTRIGVATQRWRSCFAFLEPLLSTFTSYSFVCAAGAIFLLVVTIASTGSPIDELKPIRLPKPETASWAVSTTIDKVSGLPGMRTLVGLLPFGRIGVLIEALTIYGLERIGCMSCLCIPGVDFGGFFGQASDLGRSFSSFGFRRHRRLLEHKRHLTSDGDTAVSLYDQSQEAVPHFTDLHERCDANACDGTQICVVDVVKDIVDEMQTITRYGMRLAADLAGRAIRAAIPIADYLDYLLGRLPEIDAYLVDFGELLTMPGVHLGLTFEMLTLNIGSLPFPSSPFRSLSTTEQWLLLVCFLTLVIGTLFILHRLGLLYPAVRASRNAIELSLLSTILSVVVVAYLFFTFLRMQLRAEGWDVVIVWRSNWLMYAMIALLLFISLLLRLDGRVKRARPVKPI